MPEWNIQTVDQIENDFVTYKKAQEFVKNE